SRVAHAEALAGHAADEGLAAGRPVESDVADHHVLLGQEGRLARRVDDDLSAREALADVIVGVALERQRQPARNERAEARARAALEAQLDGVLGESLRDDSARHLRSDQRAAPGDGVAAWRG